MNRQSPHSQAYQAYLPTLDAAPLDLRKDISGRVDNGIINQLDKRDRSFHDWYRFVLSFPPHLVREYFDLFGLGTSDTVLDPFCGTGTTLVEAKLGNIPSIGIEANPLAHYASAVKVDWEIDPGILLGRAEEIGQQALDRLRAQGIEDRQPFNDLSNIELRSLEPEAAALLITNSISPVPLHKTLILLDCLNAHQNERYYRHLTLALANALVTKISNLRFGPEVGVGKQKKDAPVVASWMAEVEKISGDLELVYGNENPSSTVFFGDARNLSDLLSENSISAVITSPPYPNEKDYTRTTRLESVLLGFFRSRSELRDYKKKLVRSNTRGVYREDTDDQWILNQPEVQQIAEQIERRRIEMGKNSGFERLYSRVTKLYFGGMAQHFAGLRAALRPGARLAYVVGDQASYLRVMIRTGKILAEIAQSLGYKVEGIDLFRTRFATASKEQLREEVVLLSWPGKGS